MITIKTKEEIAILREGGAKLAEILSEVFKSIEDGVTTEYLNGLAECLIQKNGAKSSFKNYRPDGRRAYPATLCTSINNEIVHAVPSKRKLKSGDLISLDLGIWWRDLCVDAAKTIIVGGEGSESAKKLVQVAEASLYEGIGVIKHGARLGDIGYAIGSYVEKNGFGVVRDLSGHGVGYDVHEDPHIFNFGKKGSGEILEAGMVLAIEPMITEGDWNIEWAEDGWGIKTRDGKLSAHFEHTVAVTKDGYEILTELR